MVEDSKAVEKVVETAQKRAARSQKLREDYRPLARLARSYAQGSYREAPKADAALALAAVMYVASPLDLVPDHLPGGLRDDEQVVSWARVRLDATLRAYYAWEDSLGPPPLPTEKSPSDAGLPATSLESLAVQTIGRPDCLLFSDDQTTGSDGMPPIALNAMVTGGLLGASALGGDTVMRVVGSDALLAGLASGKLELVQSGAGHLGTVRDAASKDWAGHLRFDGPSDGPGAGAGALAGFQIASAVTLQYYLARIDRQLGDIEETCARIADVGSNARYAAIETARRRCASIERALGASSKIGEHDAQLLGLAYHDLEQSYQALAKEALEFASRVEQTDPLDLPRKQLEGLLEDATGHALVTVKLLIFAAVVRHRVLGLQTHLYAADGPARLGQAIDEARELEIEALATLDRVRSAFRALSIPKAALDEQWDVRGGPERALQRFSTEGAPVIGLLERAPAAVPSYTSDVPFVMEMRTTNRGELEVAWAEVRPVSEPVPG